MSPAQYFSLSATDGPGFLKELREPGRKHKLPEQEVFAERRT